MSGMLSKLVEVFGAPKAGSDPVKQKSAVEARTSGLESTVTVSSLRVRPGPAGQARSAAAVAPITEVAVSPVVPRPGRDGFGPAGQTVSTARERSTHASVSSVAVSPATDIVVPLEFDITMPPAIVTAAPEVPVTGSRTFEVDGVAVVYCTDRAEAEALILEMLDDAGSHPVALDLETAAILSERERLKVLKEELTAVNERAKAARRSLAAEVKQDAAAYTLKCEITALDKKRQNLGRALKTAAGAIEFVALTDELMAVRAKMRDVQRAFRIAIQGNAVAAALQLEIERLEKEMRRIDTTIDYTESGALDSHRARIRLAQLYGGKARCAVIDIFAVGENVLGLLDGRSAVIHNAVFDVGHLGHVGVRLGRTDCTQQAAKLTLGDQHGYENAVEHYCGVKLDKTEQKSNWSVETLSESQIAYAARDVIYLWTLCDKVFRDVARTHQMSAYQIQNDVTEAIAAMNCAGVKIDLDAHSAVLQELADQDAAACETYRCACLEMGLADFADIVPRKDSERAEVIKAVATNEELIKLKEVKSAWRYSMAKSEMRKVKHYPVVAALLELKDIEILRQSFGEPLRCRVSPVTNRVHPRYRLMGADTGRASCSEPNVQGTPRNPKFRALYVANDGYVLEAGDYSGMELRAACEFFPDDNMKAAFLAGIDLHAFTAARVAGKAIEDIDPDGEERHKAKNLNFGVIYGIGASGLVEQLWKNQQITITIADAENLLKAFTDLFPQLMTERMNYVNACFQHKAIVIGKDASKGFGRIIPFSRLSWDDNQRTCACNYPIQGICADCMRAIVLVYNALLNEGVDGRLIAWIHDELIIEVSKTHAEQAKAILQREMERAFLETFPNATTNKLVEVRIGANWAEAKSKKTTNACDVAVTDLTR